METEKEWLDRNLAEFEKNPVKVLFEILASTNNVVGQAIPAATTSGQAISGLCKSAYSCNEKFLDAIENKI
jgi:hypothetical protein